MAQKAADGVCAALREEHYGGFKALTWTPSLAAVKQRVLGVPRPLATRLAIELSIGFGVWWWWQQQPTADAVLGTTTPISMMMIMA